MLPATGVPRQTVLRRAASAAMSAVVIVAALGCAPSYVPPPPDSRVALDVPQRPGPAGSVQPVTAPSAASALGPLLSEPDAVARVLPAVVRIVSERSVGTGVIVSPEGVAITAAHVVGDRKSAQVQLQDGRELTAVVEAADQWVDIARLKIAAAGLPVATLGDPAQLRLGEPLLAIGYALDLPGGQSVTRGVFSRIGAASARWTTCKPTRR